MKINRLNATFGTLNNSEIQFHEGLNIVYAPNESGKSTWCAFIRDMLYGVDTGERAKAGSLPDKQKYVPWSGAPMEGTMDLTVDRRDLTIQRSTRAKNAPMREFQAFYTGTGVPVDELNGTNCGEKLTGVNRDVFCRSAFVAQGDVAVSGSPELEKRIGAIVSTGDEEASFSEADSRLRAWENKRRYSSRGYIPEAEAKIADLKLRLGDIEEMTAQVSTLQSELTQLEDRCSALETVVTDSRRRQRKQSLEVLSSARAELSEKSIQHDKTLAALTDARENLRNGPFGMMPLEEAENTAEADLQRLSELKTVSQNRVMTLFMVLAIVGTLVLAGLYTFMEKMPYIIVAAIMAVAAVVLLLRYSKNRQEVNRAAEIRQKILRKYRATTSADITAALEEHCGLWEALNSAERAERKSRDAFENAKYEMNELEAKMLRALDFSDGSSDAVKYSRALSDAREQSQQITNKIAILKGRITAAGDPVSIRSSIQRLETDLSELKQEYDAIVLARQSLKDADTELQTRVAPQLGKLAAEYMRFVTDGKYSDVLINRDFSAFTRTEGDSVARKAEYLSAGTLDLMYLAVRLAVCELAMPEGEPCPLIIDDALVNLDAERFQQALRLLSEISKSRQVILFTCRDK